jgi:hypothetical protein
MTLNQEQLRDILSRAEEIRQQRGLTPSQRDLDEVLNVAEEAGLDRESVMQALRERLSILGEPPKIGDRIFAKSADGHYYTAKVIELREDAVKVRFGQGGEHIVSNLDLRPCSFLPGQRVMCPWPDWGWWTCRVLSFDADKNTIKASDGWGSEEVFQVSDVRMAVEKEPFKLPSKISSWLFAGAVAGGTIGSALTWLFMR